MQTSSPGLLERHYFLLGSLKQHISGQDGEILVKYCHAQLHQHNILVEGSWPFCEEQAAHISCGCPIPGTAQGQADEVLGNLI